MKNLQIIMTTDSWGCLCNIKLYSPQFESLFLIVSFLLSKQSSYHKEIIFSFFFTPTFQLMKL